MTLEESKEVIPMMEAMITQIEEQQNIMAEMLQEIQEKDEKLMCFQEKEERLQQLESELSELLQILPDTEELLILLEEKTDQIQKLTDENQQWQELAQKLNSENRLLQKQNSELAAKIQGLRQASQGRGGWFCPLLYRPVPLHLLLGAKGAGGCKGTWNPVQNHSHHRERDGTKCARTGHNIRLVPGWEVCDPEHPVGQEIFEIGRRSGLNHSGIFLIFQ